MKINACMISLILIAIVAMLLLMNQPQWMRNPMNPVSMKSKYSEEKYEEYGQEMDNGENYEDYIQEMDNGESYSHEMYDGEGYEENDDGMTMMPKQENCGCGM